MLNHDNDWVGVGNAMLIRRVLKIEICVEIWMIHDMELPIVLWTGWDIVDNKIWSSTPVRTGEPS